VQRDRVGAREVEQRVIHPVGREGGAASGGGLLVAHRNPHVGVDGVGAADRQRRIADQRRAGIRFELVALGRRHHHLEPAREPISASERATLLPSPT